MDTCMVKGCKEPVIGQMPDASGNMICQKHHDEAFPKPGADIPPVEVTNADARKRQEEMDAPAVKKSDK